MDLLLAFVYAAGSVLCHQLPERSFFLDGHQLPVCARCTGLYLGAIGGLVAWPAVRVLRGWRGWTPTPRTAAWWVAAAGAPTVVTFATGVLGVWDGSNVIRAALALPFGLAAGAVVAAVATKDLR
jgi:uncharacterized membrane protein